MMGEAHVRAECTAYEILKAERVLDTRLRKLIGACCTRSWEECGGINGAVQAVRLLLLL